MAFVKASASAPAAMAAPKGPKWNFRRLSAIDSGKPSVVAAIDSGKPSVVAAIDSGKPSAVVERHSMAAARAASTPAKDPPEGSTQPVGGQDPPG